MLFLAEYCNFQKNIGPVEDSMNVTNWWAAIISAVWLICRDRMPQNKKVMLTDILSFDFELHRWPVVIKC
jgi:hypothetical protein